MHICPLKQRERERFLLLDVSLEFMEMLVCALGTYKSPLTFDQVVVVEMFKTDLYNAHI